MSVASSFTLVGLRPIVSCFTSKALVRMGVHLDYLSHNFNQGDAYVEVLAPAWELPLKIYSGFVAAFTL
eukprot:1209215-Ditylum_brightwellii.AAC.1